MNERSASTLTKSTSLCTVWFESVLRLFGAGLQLVPSRSFEGQRRVAPSKGGTIGVTCNASVAYDDDTDISEKKNKNTLFYC